MSAGTHQPARLVGLAENLTQSPDDFRATAIRPVSLGVAVLIAGLAVFMAGLAIGLTADSWSALSGAQHSALNSQLLSTP